MNSIFFNNNSSRMIYVDFLWILIFLNLFLGSCDGPTKPNPLNIDRDIPPSEEFDASYGFWGPEGSAIYFSHDEKLGSEPEPGKSNQLWKLELETGRREMIAPGRILNADISPDGKWFVFQTFFPPQYLYKMRSDGTNLQKLTGPGSPNPGLKQTVLSRWSPNGNKILFSVSAGDPRGVAIMDSSGADPRIIIPFGIHANWIPSGKKITYVNYDTTKVRSKQQQVFIANANGENSEIKTNLESTFFNINGPSMSPDSQKIVFIYNDEVFIKNFGGDTEQLTAGSGRAVRPEWGPDGKKILFSRIIQNVSKRLYYLDVSTREVTPVFPASEADKSN